MTQHNTTKAEAVMAALRSYRCKHTVDEDNDGMELADAFTPIGDTTIERGLEEIESLADHIVDELGESNRSIDPATVDVGSKVKALERIANHIESGELLTHQELADIARAALSPVKKTPSEQPIDNFVEVRTKKMREIATRLSAEGMQCNCDLDNWEPEPSTGHSSVCRIHKKAVELSKAKVTP